jgi:hypothetical protein
MLYFRDVLVDWAAVELDVEELDVEVPGVVVDELLDRLEIPAVVPEPLLVVDDVVDERLEELED